MPLTSISSNIQAHSDPDAVARAQPRRALEPLESASVDALIAALKDSDDHARWEAAKAFSKICDPAAAPALVIALEDSSIEVRWLAAESLIRLEREGLKALLPALVDRAGSMALRDAAHHVLSILSNRGWQSVASPIVAALESAQPAHAVPPAAYRAMAMLKDQTNRSRNHDTHRADDFSEPGNPATIVNHRGRDRFLR